MLKVELTFCQFNFFSYICNEKQQLKTNLDYERRSKKQNC